MPEKFPLANEIHSEVGAEIASVLVFDQTDNFLTIRVTVPLVPFDLQKLEVAVKRRGGEYVNDKKDGKDAGYFRVPLKQKQEAKPEDETALGKSGAQPPTPAPQPETPKRISPLRQFFKDNKCDECEEYDLCRHPNQTGKIRMCLALKRFNVTMAQLGQAQQLRQELPKPVQQPQPAPQSSRTPAEDLSSMIRKELPIIEPQLQFEVKGNDLKISPKQFLEDEAFRQTLDIVTKHGGKYVSAGKNSHFTVPIPMPRAAQEQRR
jgi:hypothetical protein